MTQNVDTETRCHETTQDQTKDYKECKKIFVLLLQICLIAAK